jgi:hypothetical protein
MHREVGLRASLLVLARIFLAKMLLECFIAFDFSRVVADLLGKDDFGDKAWIECLFVISRCNDKSTNSIGRLPV